MRTAPLAGKCALITGSVRGLGLAAAQRLAASGCHIVLNGLVVDFFRKGGVASPRVEGRIVRRR